MLLCAVVCCCVLLYAVVCCCVLLYAVFSMTGQMLQAGSIGMLGEVWHYTVGTGTQAPVAISWELFTSVATGLHYCDTM